MVTGSKRVKRRILVAPLLLACVLSLLAAPATVEAQRPEKLYRIGMLERTSTAINAANLEGFRQGLRELGYVEGKNFVIEYRSADGRDERFPGLATELVRLPVDLIVTRGTPAALAAKSATGTIPVVMTGVSDPVGQGVVASLARPGGNVTGLNTLISELFGKRVGLLKELVPGATRIAVLFNMRNPSSPPAWKEVETAARSLGIQPQLLDVRKSEDLGPAFESAIRQRADALVVGQDTLTRANQRLIVDLAARHRLAAIYASMEFARGIGHLRSQLSRPLPPRRELRRQDLQGREARRPSHRAAHQVRAGHQYEDRQGARPHHSALASPAGGPGDPVTRVRRVRVPA
jgi:putative tryptophan/tyrosine transport system substrate-binding protein